MGEHAGNGGQSAYGKILDLLAKQKLVINVLVVYKCPVFLYIRLSCKPAAYGNEIPYAALQVGLSSRTRDGFGPPASPFANRISPESLWLLWKFSNVGKC